MTDPPPPFSRGADAGRFVYVCAVTNVIYQRELNLTFLVNKKGIPPPPQKKEGETDHLGGQKRRKEYLGSFFFGLASFLLYTAMFEDGRDLRVLSLEGMMRSGMIWSGWAPPRPLSL